MKGVAVKYKCIIFDLDGTLANTFPGILHSYEFAAEKMGLPIPDEKVVNEAIGAPLAEVFQERFGLNDEKKDEAIRYYRENYAQKGVFEAEGYPEMDKVLHALKTEGKVVGVATLKNEQFAKKMLANMGLSQYIDCIAGMDGKDKLTKAMLIERVLKTLNQQKENAVLVGDSSYDALGAKDAGVDFIGVTYGFGFHKSEDINAYSSIGVIKSPIELLIMV